MALDDFVAKHYNSLENIIVISITDLENEFPELFNIKSSRSNIEYIFTFSPFLPKYILKKFSYINRITTLDADLFFMSSPIDEINNLGVDGIGITLHDFPDQIKSLEVYGHYNVSFQSFPNTINGLNCINDWAEKCLNYCSDKLNENGDFADQKYLDNWKSDFKNVHDFPKGIIGLAPWNLKKYKFWIILII